MRDAVSRWVAKAHALHNLALRRGHDPHAVDGEPGATFLRDGTLTDAKQWVGRRVIVYNDPEVMFGRDKVGGIRISHLSHIDRKRSVRIRAAGAGRKQDWPVEPLPDVEPTAPAPSEPTAEEVAACTDVATLKSLWRASGPERRAQIEARVIKLDRST